MKCRTVERDMAHYIICFEIKVTVNDFYSKNGHNFVGDMNYYVMLPEVYDAVKDNISDNIGVIIAKISSNDTVTFRIKKDSTLTEISEEDRNWFLQTALSRERKRYENLEKSHRLECRSLKNGAYTMCYDIFMRKLSEIEKPSCFICGNTNFCSENNKVEKCDRCMQNSLYFHKIVRETLDIYHLGD